MLSPQHQEGSLCLNWQTHVSIISFQPSQINKGIQQMAADLTNLCKHSKREVISSKQLCGVPMFLPHVWLTGNVIAVQELRVRDGSISFKFLFVWLQNQIMENNKTIKIFKKEHENILNTHIFYKFKNNEISTLEAKSDLLPEQINIFHYHCFTKWNVPAFKTIFLALTTSLFIHFISTSAYIQIFS